MEFADLAQSRGELTPPLIAGHHRRRFPIPMEDCKMLTGYRASVPAFLLAVLAVMLCSQANAADYPPRAYEITEEREPCRDYRPLRQVFYGDTHVHTGFSLDAALQGTINTPDDAYRFARGARLGLQPYDSEGTPQRHAQLLRPLDFSAVTDHAEMFGTVAVCTNPESAGYSNFMCKIYRRWPHLLYRVMIPLSLGTRQLAVKDPRFAFLRKYTDAKLAPPPPQCGEDNSACIAGTQRLWQEEQRAAERAYDRSSDCGFTSFVAYEYTANAEVNLHRNIIFRNEHVLEEPIGLQQAVTTQLLLQALEQKCLDAGTGCDLLAIPHNPNLSSGAMFPLDESLSRDEARRWSRIERLIEVMQHKGDSECWFGPGVEDELCNFEKLPYNNFAGRFFKRFNYAPTPDDGFVRATLSEGLRRAERSGVNPWQFGLLAATDTHLGTPGAVAEARHRGHGGAGKTVRRGEAPSLPDDIEYNPGGLAGVWAEENTRDALFAAMRRREVFGTSGPRMSLRFFGGWGYAPTLCSSPDFVAQGYAGGVPMGSELLRPSRVGATPRFAVMAQRDPGAKELPSTPLQRLQIIKGWIDDKGERRQRVYDVAGNPDNGASVNVATCTRSGTGHDRLCTVWRDPDHDPSMRAWYYARAVENPSCRWSAYVCNARGVDCSRPETVGEGYAACCKSDFSPSQQERAWSSPIWYTPTD